MPNLFFIIALTIISFYEISGKVIFLHGTVSTGTTSLCREILRQSDCWKVVSEDDIFYREAVARWKAEFPEEFVVIEETINKENILHAVMRNQILFQTQASDDQRSRTLQAITTIQTTLNKGSTYAWAAELRNQITQTIIELADTHHVIVDTWFLKPEHIQQISDRYEIIHIDAYCPFLDVIKRTFTRNHDALQQGTDISSLRFFHQALYSFAGLYELSEEPQGSIDILDKSTILHGLDLVRLCLQDSPQATGTSQKFTRGEISLQEFEEYRQKILEKFTSETMYVIPKFTVDVLIRTDHNNSAESAKCIIALVNNRK